jgi:ABC-type multidrug transport system fused ATPase/permease subunit
VVIFKDLIHTFLVFSTSIQLVLGTIALLLSTAFSLAMPALFGQLIDDVSLEDGSKSELNATVTVIAVVVILSAFFTFFRGLFFTLAGERVVARLRARLFWAITNQEIAFFDKEKTGELMNRLSSDTTVLQTACTVNISIGLRNTLQILVCIAVLFALSWELTLVMYVRLLLTYFSSCGQNGFNLFNRFGWVL